MYTISAYTLLHAFSVSSHILTQGRLLSFTEDSHSHSSFLTGPISPSLRHCTEQNFSQCDVPAPDVNPTTLCAHTDDEDLPICKPYSLRGITTLKYNSKEASTTFQMHWTKPAIRCPGYSWRMRLCQSDALVFQAGITQHTSSDNHTDTIKCTAPWDDDFQPNNEYWKFYLQKNQHYIIQIERFSENNTECTRFTSPSLFVGDYGELANRRAPMVPPTYIHCVWSGAYADLS